jgi:hypothetical protein
MARLAIIGAGPIGLEAALGGAHRGFDVRVYEAGRVGEHLRRFGWVGLFTPFGMNATDLGRRRLEETGAILPGARDLLTAGELVKRYLDPLARLPELEGAIHEGTRVAHVAREGIDKTRGIVAAGDSSRSGRPFLLHLEDTGRGPAAGGGGWRVETADVLIDASGVYGNGRFTGPGGLPALGEPTLGDRIARHVPDSGVGAARALDGARVLLVGDGHSAATMLAAWSSDGAPAGAGKPARVHWVRRPRRGSQAFEEIAGDPLPARRELVERANRAVRSAPWLTAHPGAAIERYEAAPDGSVRVSLRRSEGAIETLEVDRVLALVGYRPDTSLFRELQVHLCYASEAPMALASALLTASLAEPGRAGDCLSQVPHGPETLRNPEPDFYVLGAKSYGRNASFLLTIGHQQVPDAFSLMEGAGMARTAARTSDESS